ncbi:MAG: L-threonylcarbamoyladenylate synthase [Candidatus Nanoarchaeia archaeon]|nr:L-threonylcarbamoyladenylate synthase [Candidatus Nanoarchaeia archaeon]
MEIIAINNIKKNRIVKDIREGKIFIYPTDTIYGLGCNALDREAVSKIRGIKERENKPFSVIAPSKKWIFDNFKANKSYIDKLPGPFTFVVKMNKKGIVAENVNLKSNTLGVRIPNHIFSVLVQEAKVPFITTSVNISGKKPINSVKEIPKKILKNVDIIIDEGTLNNNPSTVIDLTGKTAKILR